MRADIMVKALIITGYTPEHYTLHRYTSDRYTLECYTLERYTLKHYTPERYTSEHYTQERCTLKRYTSEREEESHRVLKTLPVLAALPALELENIEKDDVSVDHSYYKWSAKRRVRVGKI